jgi:tetratricopeptide (TPR) repeat protein
MNILRPGLLMGLLLVFATIAAYLPVFFAGFIWDDDAYVTNNPLLTAPDGLWRIWFDPLATPQYYPMVHTTFWIEYHLWGLYPMGFHIVNVVIHILGALLFWRVLTVLKVPGAWLAAAIFALHPVQVETVAWVTERKNVLSTFFYFASALACLKFYGLENGNEEGRRRNQGCLYAAFALFVAALLSKTVACSLPATVLLVIWWKRGRLQLRDVLPMLPFFAVGMALGLGTAWIEKHHVGAQGSEWALTFPERCLIAGRALCFYVGKLVWPVHLIFMYPRWIINSGLWWQWLFPVADVAVVLGLWLARHRIGRGPLVAVLFFCGTLIPALGFVNVYPMLYSFVADHFQYLACAGLIALASAGIVKAFGNDGNVKLFLKPVFCGGLLLTLGILTWRQCGMYTNAEVLWRTTIQRNPGSWMAQVNLGNLLLWGGRTDEAIAHYKRCLEINPDVVSAYYDLGVVSAQTGHAKDAIMYYHKALQLQPDLINACKHLAWVLATCPVPALRNGPEAVELAERANALASGKDPDVLSSLAAAYAYTGRFPEAIAVAQHALKLASDQNNALVVSSLNDQLKFYQAHSVFWDLSLTNTSPAQ